MASDARETFRSKEGYKYPLWTDINEIIKPLIHNYWFESREGRHKRGWMFRGQANADWDLTPSLYRAPLNDEIISKTNKKALSFHPWFNIPDKPFIQHIM